MVQPADDAPEVADPVTVRVLIRARVDLVERALAPPGIDVVSAIGAIYDAVPSTVSVVIKYLGSKRRLVPVLGEMFTASGARTRSTCSPARPGSRRSSSGAAASSRRVDTARYSEVFARCYIETDRDAVDLDALTDALERLDALDGRPGYFTETFCIVVALPAARRTARGSTRSAPRSTPTTATRRSSRSC